MSTTRRWTTAGAITLALAAVADTASAQMAAYLDQGWTDSDRQYFYRSTQGSRLMSYRVFVKLETASTTTRFASEANLGAMGYLFDPYSTNNPDNLPIGFVKDDPLTKPAALGLTCSACHTRDITVNNQYGAALRYRIDGGQAYSDTERFLRELEQALVATANNTAKFDRLCAAIGVTSATDKQAVRNEVNAAVTKLTEERLANMPSGQSVNDPGPGRLDALAHIKNRVANYVYPQNYAYPGNNIDATAPVNFPFLWDAAYQDFTQWPGTVSNASVGPYARNLGEVTGVFAETNVTKVLGVVTGTSSANVTNLIGLENKLLKLQAPIWPSDRSPINAPLANQGDALFKTYCVSCHVEVGRGTRTTYVPTFAFGAKEVGTDPMQAKNNTGDKALAGLTSTSSNTPTTPVPAGGILASVLAVPLVYASPAVLAGQGDHKQSGAPSSPITTLAAGDAAGETYKARPLNGIWATGPYLHNGSVRTLYDLLLPASNRPTSFCVGSITLDTANVGMANDCSMPNAYVFNGTKDGNRPMGHEYGTIYDKRGLPPLTANQRVALVEYLKTL
jgi:hypothetical protein